MIGNHVLSKGLCSWRAAKKLLGARFLSDLPLDGIRILDMSRILAGPYATMVLGDLGAEVIKIEKPGTGDDTRGWGPPFQGEESIYFMSINRNKKSVCIDFKTKKGVEIIKNLVCKSDVVIENFLPGKMKKHGLGYDDLKTLSPGLIYCSISGYGQTGPYAHRGGYDLAAASIGGLMHITGPEKGDPCRVGVAITDITTGLYAHGATMAAIIERQKTGEGKHIDCSLLSSQVAVLSHIAASYLNFGLDTGRLGTAHQSLVPYQSFKTSDGHLVVGTGNNRQFQALCKIIDLDYLIDDPRFVDNSQRVIYREELIPLLASRFAQEKTSCWMAKFEGCTFPYGPVNSLKQVFEDPQVRHLSLVEELSHPAAGNVKTVGPAVAYNGKHKLKPSQPSPVLGSHTKEVLEKIAGYSLDYIGELQKSGVVSCG